MSEQKKKVIHEKVLTEKGIAKFPYLNKADTKFNKDGEFRIRLILEGTDGAPIKAKLEAAAEKAYQDTKAQLEEAFKTEKGEKKAKAKKALDTLKKADLPIKDVYDDDGNETGQIELSFKMKAQRSGGEGKPPIKQFPKLFDAKGNPFPITKDIWGGSEVKVAGQIIPFYTAAVGAGASLRLSAVQIIKLNEGGGGNAESYGFGKEDGYEADPDEAAANGFSDESEGQGADGSEDF